MFFRKRLYIIHKKHLIVSHFIINNNASLLNTVPSTVEIKCVHLVGAIWNHPIKFRVLCIQDGFGSFAAWSANNEYFKRFIKVLYKHPVIIYTLQIDSCNTQNKVF